MGTAGKPLGPSTPQVRLLPRSEQGDDVIVEVVVGQESRPTHWALVLVRAAKSRSRWTTGLSEAWAFSRHCF
jgi:hypothetical protein